MTKRRYRYLGALILVAAQACHCAREESPDGRFFLEYCRVGNLPTSRHEPFIVTRIRLMKGDGRVLEKAYAEHLPERVRWFEGTLAIVHEALSIRDDGAKDNSGGVSEIKWSLPGDTSIEPRYRRRWLQYQLVEAAKENSIGEVRRLLGEGADPNLRGRSGYALHHAFERRNLAMLELLIESGARADIRGARGNNALHGDVRREEATNEDIACIKLLLDTGLDPNAQDGLGHSPLHFLRPFPEIQYLLERGASPNVRDKLGYTPLIAHASDPDTLKEMLRHGAELTPDDGARIAISAFSHGRPDIARFIVEQGIEQGIEMNAVVGNDKSATTLLNSAMYHKDISTVSLLIRHGADVNQSAGEPPRSPLQVAVEYQFAEGISLLLENGAKSEMLEPFVRKEMDRLLESAP